MTTSSPRLADARFSTPAFLSSASLSRPPHRHLILHRPVEYDSVRAARLVAAL